MKNKSIAQRIKQLTKQLYKFLDKPLKTFNEIKDIDYKGVYVVYNKKGKPIYAGSTLKENQRMKQLLNIHNHTLHRKLLCEKLGIHKLDWNKKKKYTKEYWIKKRRKFTQKKFSNTENYIKGDIKKRFRFRFTNLSSKKDNDILKFEHFVISILNPPYNDKNLKKLKSI